MVPKYSRPRGLPASWRMAIGRHNLARKYAEEMNNYTVRVTSQHKFK